MAFMTMPETEYSPLRSIFQVWRGVAGALHPYGLTETTPSPFPMYLEPDALVPAHGQKCHTHLISCCSEAHARTVYSHCIISASFSSITVSNADTGWPAMT